MQRRSDGGGYFYVGKALAALVPEGQRFAILLTHEGFLFKVINEGGALPPWVRSDGLERDNARRREDQVTAAKASAKRGRRGIGANLPNGSPG